MGANCIHPHERPGLAGAGLKAGLADAERRCSAGRQRLTEPRRRALEMLLRAGQPVKAYDLLPRFHAGGRAAKPPTVYRALDFLKSQGLAHRIESLNAYVACRRVGETHAAAFLICDCCGAAAEVELPADVDIKAWSADTGYRISAVAVEAHGLCPACAASPPL
jgi:Fur family transcriptional regulator, zinc uptake regulator